MRNLERSVGHPTKLFLITLVILIAVGNSDSAGRASAISECLPPVPPDFQVVRSDPHVSARMQQLLAEDQGDRRDSTGDDFAEIAVRDLTRRTEVMQYLESGRLGSAEDLFAAALIFEHGNCSAHYQLAAQLAMEAFRRGHPVAGWLHAASLDRYLLSKGERQRYGTQFTLVDCTWTLEPVDPDTTDADRIQLGVPPLSEALSPERLPPCPWECMMCSASIDQAP